ncbi:MAG: hypothetical protein IPH12_01250 [Saprospirales bacterium]|nr:hypothetical protein [Saprospirales bacterium]
MFHLNPIALYIFLAGACLASCSPAAYRYADDGPGGPITHSLFEHKERTISEFDIPRILDGKIALRDTIRLAVFQFGAAQARRIPWYDEENLKTQQQWLDSFTLALQRAPRIQRVQYLPGMITGDNPDIHQLRESAVRLQADMLLVYSLNSDLFLKYRTFKKEEAKAFATCEILLMDIRTGVIPFTYIATTSAQSKKEKSDFDPGELNKRARDKAVLQVMLECGQKVADFLSIER